MRILFFFYILIFPTALLAQVNASNDSIPQKETKNLKYSTKQLIIPAALFTYGIVAIESDYLKLINVERIAFIFTRPFGAAFGDLLTKPLSKGGLELGTLPSSMVSIAIMTILIFMSHKQHNRKTISS